MCGKSKDADGIEAVAVLARDVVLPDNNSVLKMSAVATLGDIGNQDDIEFLESQLNSSDENMRKIAQMSLDKIANH